MIISYASLYEYELIELIDKWYFINKAMLPFITTERIVFELAFLREE